ncbi:MAG: glycine zipper 2TM domain-containing protein [Stellaceae bacterium]
MGLRRRHAPAFCAALLALALAASGTAIADPPPWAPAYGYRAKHHHDRDDGDRRAPPPTVVPAPVVIPYGLAQGRCDRELVGAALGGAAGGLVGSHFGKSSGRTAATIGGVLAGMFIGGSIGHSMDQVDQACAAKTLEYVPDRQTVVWQGTQQQGYSITPIRTYQAEDGRYCREYQSTAVIAGRTQEVHGTACRAQDETWHIVR